MTSNQRSSNTNNIVLLSIMGGIGVGASLLFPYFQISVIINHNVSVFDLGILIWLPLIVVALLSIRTGIDLNSDDNFNPRPSLGISSLLIVITGLLLVFSASSLDQQVITGVDVTFPLQNGLGLMLAIISCLMIVVAFYMSVDLSESRDMSHLKSFKENTDLEKRFFRPPPRIVISKTSSISKEGEFTSIIESQLVTIENLIPQVDKTDPEVIKWMSWYDTRLKQYNNGLTSKLRYKNVLETYINFLQEKIT